MDYARGGESMTDDVGSWDEVESYIDLIIHLVQNGASTNIVLAATRDFCVALVAVNDISAPSGEEFGGRIMCKLFICVLCLLADYGRNNEAGLADESTDEADCGWLLSCATQEQIANAICN